MRPNVLLSRRWLRMSSSRLAAYGAAVVLAAGLTISAVSAAMASGHPPASGAGHAGATGHRILATGSPGIPGGPAGGVAQAAGPRPPRSVTVLLPTGDRVRLDVTGNGLPQATPVPATVNGRLRRPATFMRFTWGGDQYVVPDAALPYLRSALDPRLFDVSYLARARLDTSSAGIPVHITYTSPAAAAGLPGVRVIHRSGVTATATIGARQATRLGQFLAAQWRAAYARHSPVPVGRLPGIAKITLAPPRSAPPPPASLTQAPARPGAAAKGLPFYTLTLKATDLNGNPGTFGGIVQNVGNASLFDQDSCAFIGFQCGASAGTESLSVPRGTYSLAISVVTPDSAGGFVTALVVKPQVTVHSNTTVTLDARTAVPYSVHLHTAVSATQRIDELAFWRTSASGGADGAIGGFPAVFLGLVSYSPNPYPGLAADALRATPTAPVTAGSFFFDASTQLSGGSAPGPQYVLDFPDRGSIPSSLTYTVPAKALTRVHSHLYQTPLSSGCTRVLVNSFVFFPVGNGAWNSQEFQASAVAGERTDYWYSGDPALDLWQYIAIYNPFDSCPLPILGLNGPIQSIRHGQQITATWNRAPLAPSSLAPPYWGGDFLSLAANDDLEFLGKNLRDPRRLTACTACRQGDIGALNVLAYGDSGPAQYDDWLYTGEDSALRFYRNGTLAIDTAAGDRRSLPLGFELPLLPQPATYRLDWTEGQRNGDAPPGASIETDWTFRSGPADPAASLPATETCAPDATRPCAFLPLLFPSYDLPLNDSNQATAGTPEQVNFMVTGQQNAPAPSGLSAAVSASFDGGQTWTTPQAAASLGGGRFTATISQPPLASTDGFVSLRVTATDGSGDSVTQTITDAYGLTS
jgi:hypothetical protein